MEDGNARLIADLRHAVGRRHVLATAAGMRRYCSGFRFGSGRALAVVRPGSLVEQWRVLRLCIAARKIVIVQAANTGLTGGSTPDGDDYDRDVVVVSTLRIAQIHLLDGGRQVLCLPGATLHQLERQLAPLGRNPHSVIGSSCIGASVLGGICNNSGGALVQRGPAYTQMTLYACVNANGELRLVNHLGIRIDGEPEEVLDRIERGDFRNEDVVRDPHRHCSDHDYSQHVRDIDAVTPARFNADPRRLFEAAGCAGKVMLFAARLDTFPREQRTADFYIGSNDPDELTQLRRHMLARFKTLPLQGEYVHRDAFSLAEKYGKDMFLLIRRLGTERLPALFALKARVDAMCVRFRFAPKAPFDRFMQALSALFPRHLPARLYEYHERFEHHLAIRMADEGIDEARAYLASIFPSATGAYFECTLEEGAKAFLHRFVVAGAAIRYRVVHREEVEDIVALDVALPRNCTQWFEHLPDDLASCFLRRIYYGHFFCHVFHQDYILKAGHDAAATEHEMWNILDARGAEYPAEHNVGHLYPAKPALLEHYRALDPSNSFNPGIGQATKRAFWKAP